MTLIYDLVFLLFAVCYLPVFIFKRKMHKGFAQRLGFLSGVPDLGRPIWVHAVSVGEAMSVKHLIEELRIKFPQKDFVISTVTPTGNKIARSIAGKSDAVIYLPLDLSWIVRAVVNKINPSLFVIVETEIWPNLICRLNKNKVPIAVVNARISDRSFKGYLMIRPALKPVLNKVGIFCVQTALDSQRLARLGVEAGKIKNTGNMKFDIKVRDYDQLKKDYSDYRGRLGLGTKEKLWVCASTHPGEEEDILRVYLNLSREHPELKLLIAPRHPERSPSIANLVNACPGFCAAMISRLAGRDPGLRECSGRRPVFILDTIGQLMYFYALCDIVFVGGSLVKKGGHNILEPASLGKPVVFGKYMFNFRDIADLFVKNRAGIMVEDRDGLEKSLKDLLGDNSRIRELGQACREVIFKNKGATSANAGLIRELLKS